MLVRYNKTLARATRTLTKGYLSFFLVSNLLINKLLSTFANN